jgi:hypothetical protein
MKGWLKALVSETLLSVWWMLSALSTLSTFFLKGWSGKLRLVSAISASVGFAWANFRVFQKQQREILRLNGTLASHEVRVSQLRITPDNGSRYILARVGDVPHGEFRGGYLEFHLMIENTGRRDSTVNNYKVEIMELEQAFQNLNPIDGGNSIQGRHCQHVLQRARILSTTGNIRIQAENATNHGTLLFFVPDINLEQFLDKDLRMQGEHRKFGALRCRLTLTDTMRTSATCEFRLDEE